MITQINHRLKIWVEAILGTVSIRLEPPQDGLDGEGVNLYLLELISTPAASSNHTTPLQFSLRYLVSTWATKIERAHDLLGDLALAALDTDEIEVEFVPVSVQTWVAFGVLPRPSFILRMLVRKPRVESSIKYVEKPLIIETALLSSLAGLIRTSNHLPIVGARVELPSLHRSTESDAQGRFWFDTIPSTLPTYLQIKAKGRVLNVTIERPTTIEDPVEIIFDLLKIE